MAADDAKKLHSAGEGKWGTDESVFNMILATRSWPHLRMVFHEYERLTGYAFERAVQREFSGDVETGMLAIVKCAKNRAQYYAERLHQSLAGLGTKDNDLIFIMVSRADIDLGSIANEYQKMYNKALAKDISGDTSGDYKKVLLGLLGA
jgi:annexin A7/11